MRQVLFILAVLTTSLTLRAQSPVTQAEPATQADTPATQPAEPVVVRQGSVRELLLTQDAMARTGDRRPLVQLVDPKYRESARISQAAQGDLEAAFASAADAVEAKLGSQAARPLRIRPRPLESPLAKARNADGSIDWAKVQIAEEDGRAAVVVAGVDRETLIRVDGLWYVAPLPSGKEQSPEAVLARVQANQAKVDQVIAALAKFKRAVNAGEVTAANFREQWDQTVAPALGRRTGTAPATQPDPLP